MEVMTPVPQKMVGNVTAVYPMSPQETTVTRETRFDRVVTIKEAPKQKS